MIAIDTNIIVRFIVNDDKKQADYAEKLITQHPIFIPKTVLLETEWVLRYAYELSAEIIIDAFEKLFGLPHINIEDPACIIKAMQWYQRGFDFAGAMHLASAQHAASFATLDKKLISAAKKINIDLLTIK